MNNLIKKRLPKIKSEIMKEMINIKTKSMKINIALIKAGEIKNVDPKKNIETKIKNPPK
jgi:hypothetical protein